MINAAPLFYIELLETLTQNGKPQDENGSHVNGDGPTPTVRHRSHGDEPDVSAKGATESSKPYTNEQLEAVRKSVYMLK